MYSPIITGNTERIGLQDIRVDMDLHLPFESEAVYLVRLYETENPFAYFEESQPYTGNMNYTIYFNGLKRNTHYSASVTPVYKGIKGTPVSLGSAWTGMGYFFKLHKIL